MKIWIKLKKLNKISLICEKTKILDFDNMDLDISLSKLRELCGNKLSEKHSFLFFGNAIENDKENEISISNIIDKNNCIYIEILNKNLKENIKENPKENVNNEEKQKKNKYNLNYYLSQIEKLSILLKDFIVSPEERKKSIEKEYFLFKKKYGEFNGIKRFAIPVFGIISSGKSTFLNYILNLDDLLEMDEDISTQFICIIRNKKGFKKPKLYNVKIDFRDEKYFNFIKDNEINGDIKSIISQKNNEIKVTQNRNPKDYFLLLEIEIPFLNDSESDYSDLYEFIDFPGLNESVNNDGNKIDLFYKDYLPLILPNTTFPIFIFDLNKFEGIESSNILKYYKDYSNKFNYPDLENICKKTYNEAIFILNKSDLLENDDEKNKQLNIFREKYELNESNSLYFSSKEKLLENNKFNSFIQFIEYIIESKFKISNKFIEQLKYFLKKELNI